MKFDGLWPVPRTSFYLQHRAGTRTSAACGLWGFCSLQTEWWEHRRPTCWTASSQRCLPVWGTRGRRIQLPSITHQSPQRKCMKITPSVMSDDSDKNLKQRISNKVRVNDTFDFFKFKIISVLTKKKNLTLIKKNTGSLSPKSKEKVSEYSTLYHRMTRLQFRLWPFFFFF